MTKIGDDLFTSYRKYKGMNVDNPEYEPLESGVMSKDEIRKLKARDYAEKNKEKIKIKRLEKIVDNLRAENKTLRENQKQVRVEEEKSELLNRIEELEESNQTLLKERNSKADSYMKENNGLIRELEKREKDFEEFKNAVRVIMRFL